MAKTKIVTTKKKNSTMSPTIGQMSTKKTKRTHSGYNIKNIVKSNLTSKGKKKR